MTTVGVYLAGIILQRARLAHDRIIAADDLESARMDAIDAIVFAAASTEAFINEFTWTAYERAARQSSLVAPPAVDPVQRAGHVLQELEESHAAIHQKYSVCRFLLSGENYDRGTQPWKDFSDLVSLRNGILHLKMDAFEFRESREKYPSCVRRLSNRGILGRSGVGVAMPWIAMVATRAAAKWAINGAANIVISILDSVPANDPLRDSWRSSFDECPEE